MRNIVLISHGLMAQGVKSSLEMIIGSQEHVHVVSMPADSGDNVQFENDLNAKMKALNGEKLIIADLLGGTPCNVALKNYAEDEAVSVIAGMNLPMVLEAAVNEEISIDELIKTGKMALTNVKTHLTASSNTNSAEVDLTKFAAYKGKANLVNVRIDERLIHGQVAGIWTTSLDTQRIIVANDEAASDTLQKSSLRMAAPSSMRLSVLPVAEAAENINAGKYGSQRIFLLFKNPADVLKFLEAGGQISVLNVGNMSYKEGSREVTKNIKVMPEEEKIFQTISDKSVKITAQLVPSEPAIDFMEKLHKI